jgi:hypothetical protein
VGCVDIFRNQIVCSVEMTKRGRDSLSQNINRVGNSNRFYFERQNMGVRMRAPNGTEEEAIKHAAKAAEIIEGHSGDASTISESWKSYLLRVQKESESCSEVHNDTHLVGISGSIRENKNQADISHVGDNQMFSEVQNYSNADINESIDDRSDTESRGESDFPFQERKILKGRVLSSVNPRRRSTTGAQEANLIRWDYQDGFRERGHHLRKSFEEVLSNFRSWGCTMSDEFDRNGFSSDSAGYSFELPGSVRLILKRFPYFIEKIDAITRAL